MTIFAHNPFWLKTIVSFKHLKTLSWLKSKVRIIIEEKILILILQVICLIMLCQCMHAQSLGGVWLFATP